MCVVFVASIFVSFCAVIGKFMMEGQGLCSLEDDDYSGLFITQEPSQKSTYGDLIYDENDEGGGSAEAMDQGVNDSECSLVEALYSDISDAEDDFMNPIYGRVNE